MDSALISGGGAGLLGAFIGASAALGGKWIDARHARKAEKRRQTDELLAKFWEATDRLWRASMSLWQTIQDIQANRQTRDPIDELEVRRLREIQEKQDARIEARFLLARMRLLKLDVVTAAEALVKASEFMLIKDLKKLEDARQAALDTFEAKAAKLVK